MGVIIVCCTIAMGQPAPAAQAVSEPLVIARTLAAKYPAQPIMSYIPALAWSNSLRLSELTGEPQWREKALKDIEAFTSGKTPAKAEPYRLTSLAGALAFLDAWTIAGDGAAQKLAMEIAPACRRTPSRSAAC